MLVNQERQLTKCDMSEMQGKVVLLTKTSIVSTIAPPWGAGVMETVLFSIATRPQYERVLHE